MCLISHHVTSVVTLRGIQRLMQSLWSRSEKWFPFLLRFPQCSSRVRCNSQSCRLSIFQDCCNQERRRNKKQMYRSSTIYYYLIGLLLVYILYDIAVVDHAIMHKSPIRTKSVISKPMYELHVYKIWLYIYLIALWVVDLGL